MQRFCIHLSTETFIAPWGPIFLAPSLEAATDRARTLLPEILDYLEKVSPETRLSSVLVGDTAGSTACKLSFGDSGSMTAKQLAISNSSRLELDPLSVPST